MSEWDAFPMATQTPTRSPGKLSVQDNKFLNELRSTAGQPGLDAQNEYRRAAKAVDRLGTGPVRASLLDAFIPEEGGGFWDRVGGIIGAPFIDRQTVDDFQTLKGLQSERVLSQQLAQKGPQTESDAARLQLTEVSPYKTPEANRRILDAGMRKATLGAMKPDFYTRWTNRYGLNGTDERGRTVDAAWGEVFRRATTAPLQVPGGAPQPGRQQAAEAPAAQPAQPKVKGPMRIRTDAEYALVPKGALFIDPEGNTRRKP